MSTPPRRGDPSVALTPPALRQSLSPLAHYPPDGDALHFGPLLPAIEDSGYTLQPRRTHDAADSGVDALVKVAYAQASPDEQADMEVAFFNAHVPEPPQTW
jgi:hypothetical protein